MIQLLNQLNTIYWQLMILTGISKDNTCTSKEVVGGYYRLLDPCGGNLVGTRELVNSSVGIKTVN